MPDATLSGADFKKQLREGKPKMGLFLNAHSPTVAEQLAHSGYDWLLVDTQLLIWFAGFSRVRSSCPRSPSPPTAPSCSSRW